ncbi:MFS transporter [Gordonia sp. NB41Y]|uniref:MFS transporter n=1 Tax=Gordonia sp. NB41Y TaxID=875808 RepID=UPI0002BF6E23|nr:MFS transporter [Gordonia sp. NB41Y]EMP10490.1 hypothetical protein ISGA_5297 [Gordonia sp. NB41Y]WLP92318.1 MFS transporter [Gordonia sp. NB41Y]
MTRTRDAQSASAGVVDPGDHVSQKPSLLRQPPAVWAVAFASMVAFMGIGLVGPILPTISEDLGATPTQTSLLFTSYLIRRSPPRSRHFGSVRS